MQTEATVTPWCVYESACLYLVLQIELISGGKPTRTILLPASKKPIQQYNYQRIKIVLTAELNLRKRYR